jgi:predicted branched-subunit amino acid permease
MVATTSTATTTSTAAGGHRAARAPHRDVLAGARAMAPWLVGIVPFGIAIGVSASRTDLPILAGWLTGALIYGGSAQVAVIDLLGAGAAPVVVVAAALAINARLVLYSATMAPRWRATPRSWRALAAYLLVEPSLAVGIDGYDRTADPERGHRHYLGGAVLLWVAWLLAIAVGATAGTRLPVGLQLEFVVPLFLAGEVASRLTSRPVRHAAAVAAVVAVAALPAPLHVGPLVAIAAGSVAGVRTAAAGR